MKTQDRILTRKGQGLIEYVLVVLLIAVATIGVVRAMGNSTHDGFQKANSELDRVFK